MARKRSDGSGSYPRQEAADWEIAGAIAEIAMAQWGIASAKSAEARLRRALELVPNHLEGLNLLAQVCAQTSRHAEAFALLERTAAATASRPADLVLIGNALAETYEGRGDFRRAKSVYERCLQAVRDAKLLNGLGYCLAKLGNLAGAIRYSEEASRLEPQRADLLNDWAWSLIEAGRPAEALPLLERAVTIDPADELARGNLEHCRNLLSGPTRRAPKRRPKERSEATSPRAKTDRKVSSGMESRKGEHLPRANWGLGRAPYRAVGGTWKERMTPSPSMWQGPGIREEGDNGRPTD